MPWKRVDVAEQRLQFVIRAASGKEAMASLCREFGIARSTGYHGRRRYVEAGSFTAVQERSRRPQHSPRRTEPTQQARVVSWRQQTGWGAKKLQVVLREQEGIVLPVRTIHRILERQGLVSEGVHAPAPQRFERAAPNELWQMDSKGKYPLPQAECHPLSIVDDHSRYAVGLFPLAELSGENAWPCLVETFQNYGVPEAMLMDRGTLWWSPHKRLGLDSSLGAVDRARDRAALWAHLPSADPGQGGALPAHAGRGTAAAGTAHEVGGMGAAAGRDPA